MEKKRKSGMSFKAAYLSVGILPMLIGMSILAVSLMISLKGKIEDGIVNELDVAAEQLNEYFAYDIEANGFVDYDEYSDHEYMKSLQMNSIELTLFQGDTRFLSSLKNSDGSYNEGTKANSDIYAMVSKGEKYTSSNVKIGDTEYFVLYSPVYDGNGNFWGMAFAGEPSSKVSNTVREAIISVVILFMVLIIVVSVLIYFLCVKLTKTCVDLNDSIKQLSEGKMNTNFKITSVIKEFTELFESGEKLRAQLVKSAGGAKNTAIQLNESVTELNELSASSAEGAGMIAKTIGDLAGAAQNMAESVQNANQTIADMGDSIDNIAEKVDGMNKSSEASLKANTSAVEYMNKLTTASERTTKAVQEISEEINKCSEAATKIKAATDAITEISSQTNLLSLNASIEAARAGEAGRGFAVVASEIQKLAEQSNSSAEEIQNVIQDILDEVESCVNKANEMTKVIDEQMGFLNETKEKIDAMSVTGKDLADGARLIDEESQKLTNLKSGVLASISELSTISEELAASSEEVSSTIENIASAVESTNEEAEAMKQLADELDDKMAFFEI